LNQQKERSQPRLATFFLDIQSVYSDDA